MDVLGVKEVSRPRLPFRAWGEDVESGRRGGQYSSVRSGSFDVAPRRRRCISRMRGVAGQTKNVNRRSRTGCVQGKERRCPTPCASNSLSEAIAVGNLAPSPCVNLPRPDTPPRVCLRILTPPPPLSPQRASALAASPPPAPTTAGCTPRRGR